MFRYRTWILLPTLVVVWCVSLHAQGPQQQILLAQIFDRADNVLEQLKQDGANVIGVLKFQVEDRSVGGIEGDDTLGLECSDWMENALRGLGSDEGVRVVQRASDVASKVPAANHRTSSGRKRLFAATYRLPKGDATKVDAFVTGRIIVKEDLSSIRVVLQTVLNRPSRAFRSVYDFHTSTGGVLSQIGVPYLIRDGEPVSRAHENAYEIQTGQSQANHPVAKNPLASLEVFYDDQPVPVRIIEGKARLPEPQQGQRVTLRLERKDQSDRVLAAVVRVNGENVLSKERVTDLAAPKYVLERGARPVPIKGFQKNLGEAIPFEVAGAARSRELETIYGSDVGTITLTLFEQGDSNDALDPVLKSVATGKDLERLQGRQPVRPAMVARGVLVPGNGAVPQPIRIVDERIWKRTPILSFVLHYYLPTDR